MIGHQVRFAGHDGQGLAAAEPPFDAAEPVRGTAGRRPRAAGRQTDTPDGAGVNELSTGAPERTDLEPQAEATADADADADADATAEAATAAGVDA